MDCRSGRKAERADHTVGAMAERRSITPAGLNRRASRSLDREVARSLDAPVEALPHLDYLLKDLRSLGSTPRRIVNWLEEAGVGPGWRLLDLGCGKGAASISAARRLGCEVLGVDAFAPFVEEAREAARRSGVADRCRFERGDYRTAMKVLRARREKFDAGLMLSVAPVDEAAAVLGSVLRKDGLFIIDDAVWAGPAEDAGEMPTLEQVHEFFEDSGDQLLREHVFTPNEVLRMEAMLQRKIRARAMSLARRKPQLKPMLRRMMEQQKRAVDSLSAGPLRPVLWMVRRDAKGMRTMALKGQKR
jgi:SAM-dependent methyltransferase